ncbi:MAG: hypothetical protein IJJ33_02210, partial [Victivallales bacterium]|nr:hypothetical protein [Victivallales bacterium]
MATQTISSVEFNVAQFKKYDATQGTYVNGDTVKGHLYTVEGVTDDNGDLRKLSMAELVMVICLARAAEKEEAIIKLMKTMSDNTAILESLTDIETKLLAGTSLSGITDKYTYDGLKYSAEDFLAIVVGGATPSSSPTMADEMVTLWNQLDSNHIIDVTGSYSYGGTTYTKAYEFLYHTGMTYLTQDRAEAFYKVCSFADSLAAGASLSDDDVNEIINYQGVDHLWWPNMTKEDLVQEIDNTYKEDLLNYVQTLGWASGNGSVSNASSYLPSDKDELITQIESKMDSLNSFSQQKM